MRRTRIIAALALGVILLIAAALASSCSPPQSSLCVAPKPYPSPGGVQTLDDQTAVVDACLQQWSRRLAPAPDTLTELTDAVIAACDGAIFEQAMRFARESMKIDGLKVAPPADRAGARATARRTALMLVAQARAGKCPAP